MALTRYHHYAKEPASGEPVIFTFHGTGGDEHQFVDLLTRTRPGAGIVSPRGDVDEYGAARFFRRKAEGVYDMADLAARTARMTGFIRAHKDARPNTPVWGLGYSNGANILASVLFGTADLFDRVALMHPLIPFEPTPNPALSGLEMLITAGTHDPICPLPLTRALEAYFRDQGVSVELSLHQGGHEVGPDEVGRISDFLKA